MTVARCGQKMSGQSHETQGTFNQHQQWRTQRQNRSLEGNFALVFVYWYMEIMSILKESIYGKEQRKKYLVISVVVEVSN